MAKYNQVHAQALVDKSRSYGPEKDEMTEQLAAAIEYVADLERQVKDANAMIGSMLRMQEYEHARKA